MKIFATGNGNPVTRDDGTISVTNGRALFTSKNGVAIYSFEEILNVENNTARHIGPAFFDSNPTGNLEFLKSVVGVYKSLIDEDGSGTFGMWQLQ